MNAFLTAEDELMKDLYGKFNEEKCCGSGAV